MSAPDRSALIPSARRLTESLRDIGYDLPSAAADLVDNSIDAGADQVSVDTGRRGSRSFVRFVDNGGGMTSRELDEAMRYGSHRSYAPGELGRFGLGLKTASLSQCRRLTVATRTTPKGRIEVRRWDLDAVARRDTWALERLTPSICVPELVEPLSSRAGTVVMWEKLDRVLDYRNPDGAAAMGALDRASSRIREHLEMVFHRFLSGERRREKVRMVLDGVSLEPWDPFARSEPRTQCLPPQSLCLDVHGRDLRVLVSPFVLPAQIQFSSPENHERASGPRRWNRQQGLYIYRADRLIQSGGWNRLRTADEHSKLSRIAVDLPPGGDGAFGVNVAKMRVSLPAAVRPELAAIASGVVAHAQQAYRQRIRLVEAASQLEAPGLEEPTEPGAASVPWPDLTRVLHRELAEHPELLRSTLLALANLNTAEVPPPGTPVEDAQLG